MLADPSLVATNKFYFIKSTGRTKDNLLDDKVAVPNNLWGTPGTYQRDTHLYGSTKALSLVFWESKHFVSNSWTGESDTANKIKYVSI